MRLKKEKEAHFEPPEANAIWVAWEPDKCVTPMQVCAGYETLLSGWMQCRQSAGVCVLFQGSVIKKAARLIED